MKNVLKNHLVVVSEHWKILRDEFYDIDPAVESVSEDEKFVNLYAQENLLCLKKSNYHLELGWYGGNETGFFGLYLFRGENWHECQLLEKRNNSSYIKVLEFLNKFIENVDGGKYDDVDFKIKEIDYYFEFKNFSIIG